MSYLHVVFCPSGAGCRTFHVALLFFASLKQCPYVVVRCCSVTDAHTCSWATSTETWWQWEYLLAGRWVGRRQRRRRRRRKEVWGSRSSESQTAHKAAWLRPLPAFWPTGISPFHLGISETGDTPRPPFFGPTPSPPPPLAGS